MSSNKKQAICGTCGTCGKEFTRKKEYNSHILVCDEIEKSKYQLEQRENQQDENQIIPSQKVMFQMIQTLVEKCNRLENEVAICKKYIKQTKKKISILHWLNEYYPLQTSYDEWKKTIKVDGENIKYVFNHGYIDGVLMILQKHLPLDNVEHHVIKCFDQKQGIFFYYNNETWNVMDNDVFQKLLVYLNIELTREFDEGWVEPNKEKIFTEKLYSDMYYTYEKKIQGDNKTNEQLIRGIKSKLYTYLKCNLKNIIEYEFTF